MNEPPEQRNADNSDAGPNSIDYSEHEIHIYSRVRQLHEADEAIYSNPESLEINPDNLNVYDEVTVVWNLTENE